MKKLFTLSYFVLLISYSLFSQNVGIGTNSPNASALLDVTANNKGVLVPRVTNAQMVSIASPANGLLVYNTDSASFAYRNATACVFLKGNATASNDWSTKGNAGTDTSKNFIGTTDNVDLVFKRNNLRAGLINEVKRNTSWGAGALNTTVIGTNNTANGYRALTVNSIGSFNTANGAFALLSNTVGNSNTAYGYLALELNTIGSNNTANGAAALFFNNEGSSNTASGNGALFSNTVGYSNVAMGKNALSSNIDRSNLVAIGDSALYNNGTGATDNSEAIKNTAVGSKALYANNTGYNNTGTGHEALKANTIGYNNTATGAQSLGSNQIGSRNTANGFGALFSNISGNENAANGTQALLNNIDGSRNTASGFQALFSNSSGVSNVAIGAKALYSNTNRSNLVAIGDSALFNNGTGITNSEEATSNTAVGSKVLYSNTKGKENTAVGFESLKNNITGRANTAMGCLSMNNSSIAVSNNAFGYRSLLNNNGSLNVAIGNDALSGNSTGNYNTAVGNGALSATSTGSNNTALGYGTGIFNTGSSNVFFGYSAGRNETGSNKLYISNDATDAANTLLYGEFDNKLLRSNGRMEINSDNTLNDGLRVIKNYAAGTNKNRRAVYGENIVDNNWGIGVEGKGGETGVQGICQASGSAILDSYAGVKGISDGINFGNNAGVWGLASGASVNNRAVLAEATGNTGLKYGVYASAVGAGNNYAVFGEASGGTTNYAGYFVGNIFANGKLTITTTAGTTGIDLSSSDAYAEMRVIRNTLNATDKDLYLGFLGPVGSGVHLYSDGSETVTVKSKLVGVGKTPLTSNADSRLQIKQTGSQNGIGIEASNSTNHWDFFTTFDAASNLSLYYNGTYKGIFSNVNGAYTMASDRRMKKDISTYTPAMNSLLQLQTYQYHYLDNKPSDNFSTGFMAQDVQKLFPDAVVENTMKDGETRLGINYQYFTVLAIKGLQEQQQQIQSQEERIAKLEALVKTLVDKK